MIDQPLILALEARLTESRRMAAFYERKGFAGTALAWSYKADAYAEGLRLAKLHCGAYSDDAVDATTTSPYESTNRTAPASQDRGGNEAPLSGARTER